MNKKPFRPSADLVRAAETLMASMAMEQTVRPIVEAYEHAILAKHRFPPAEQYREHVTETVILDRKSAFLLGDADFQVYLAECFAARDAAGLKVSKPENCPLLEAESTRVNAEGALIKQVGNIPGLETFKEAHNVMNLDMRKRLVDITLRLVAPFVDDADGVLKRIMTA